MYRFISLLLVFFIVINIHGQQSISGGVSYYEYLNISYTKKMSSNSYQITFGVKPYSKTSSLSYSVSMAIFWDKTAKYTGSRWPIYLTNRFIYWNKDNENYNWKIISAGLGVCGKIYIVENFGFCFEMSPVASYVLSYRRKTNENLAWPRLFGFNYGMGIFKQF
jgi:hypothetical protein